MGHNNLNMFTIDYRRVQDSLVIDVLFIWLHVPVDSRGIIFCLNTIFLFYQTNFKLMPDEFPSSVIRDFHWPWILDHPHSFYQVVSSH